MAEICENQVPVDELKPQDFCDICHTSFIDRSTPISVGGDGIAILIPTLRYRLCLFPLGFGLGKHLYSTTLVPGEEIELEIFRSTKTVEELSKETSIEETFSQELSNTVQDEWSNKQSSNFKIGAGGGGSIFGIDLHAEADYSTQEETFQKVFNEFVAKAQAKTDRKSDMRMDVKTETVSSERSTRKLRNFNQCQPVTYNYFQLMRKMRLEVTIDAVTFDLPSKLHPVFTDRLGLLNVARFTPPRPQEILGAFKGLPVLSGGPPARPPTLDWAQATVQHPIIADDFNQPVRQLTLEQLEKLVVAKLSPVLQTPIMNAANRIVAQFPVGSLVLKQKFCVNTTGVTVEAFTGHCLACDTHTALVLQAEREKLRADLLKAKLSTIAAAAAFGFVRAATGPLPGAVVRLKKAAGAVLGETVTDADGLYILSAKGLAAAADALTVDIATLPTGLSSTTPANGSFKLSDAPVEVDFVAT